MITGNHGGDGHQIYDPVYIAIVRAAVGGIGGGTSGLTTLKHCTITSNHGGDLNGVPDARGGITGGSGITLVNCIVWGNLGAPGGYPANVEIGPPSFPWFGPLPTATWCDIGGGYPGVGNFNANPAFVAPGSDYHLTTGSPCVDLGTGAGVSEDVDRVGRPQYFAPDVGAYEWRPPVALTLSISQPGGPSSATITTSGGAAGEWYIDLFTDHSQNGGPYAGTGQWGGLFIAAQDLSLQIGFGAPPFVGTLDASGNASSAVTLPPGLSGQVIYAISHTVGGPLVNRRSLVLAYTLL